MSTDFLRKIEENENTRRNLIVDLIKVKKMVKGSFCQIHVKCGKKNCWCTTGKGHSHWRMSIKEKGKSFSRAVPPEEYDWIKEMTTNYREFKKLRKQIIELETETKNLLDSYESDCTKQSKKGKTYLETENGISEVKSKKVSETPKAGDRKK